MVPVLHEVTQCNSIMENIIKSLVAWTNIKKKGGKSDDFSRGYSIGLSFSQYQVVNTYKNSMLNLALIHYVFLYSNISGSFEH